MTDSREFNAATVQEALAKASERLGIPEAELSYEVLDAGSDGFLGIGARDARITVSVDAAAPDAADDIEPEPAVSTFDSDPSPASEPVSQEPDAPSDLLSPAEEDEEMPDEAPPELLEEVREYVTSVVRAMGLGSRVDVYDTDEYVAVDVVSDHTALLIGQKGETIDSLQHLVNSAVYKDRPFVKRIILDSEGYRQRRIEAIQGMAHRTARKSVRERRDVKMPPMNSSERRIVHVYLKDHPEVTTFSEGTGDERRVTVSPK